MPGYGIWQGAERATRQMAATGMQLLQFQTNKQIQEDKMKLFEEQAGRERTIFENQQKKLKEQEAIQDAIIPASVINPKFHESPRVRQQYIESLKGMGFEITETPDEIYAPKKAFDALSQMMKTSHETISMAAENKILDLQDAAGTLSAQIQELTQSGKDDEKTMGQIQKLQAQKLTIHTQIAEAMNLSKEVQRAIAMEKAKSKTADTDEIREYNLAVQQGETRTFTEWKKGFKEVPGEKSQTEEQLTARALRGDTEAQAILNAMQKRKSDIASLREGGTRERADRQFAVTLRKEFNALPEVTEYNQTMPKIKSMQSAYEESKKSKNFVAIDQALITLYNKLTDPSSVVRESEYARTAENIPLINQIRGKAEKVLKGGAGLTGEERKALMDMAMLMQKGYEEIRARRLNEYRGYGVQGGLTPEFLSDATGSMTAPKKVGRFVVEVE